MDTIWAFAQWVWDLLAASPHIKVQKQSFVPVIYIFVSATEKDLSISSNTQTHIHSRIFSPYLDILLFLHHSLHHVGCLMYFVSSCVTAKHYYKPLRISGSPACLHFMQYFISCAFYLLYEAETLTGVSEDAGITAWNVSHFWHSFTAYL